jgi:hypothetical protein
LAQKNLLSPGSAQQEIQANLLTNPKINDIIEDSVVINKMKRVAQLIKQKIKGRDR